MTFKRGGVIIGFVSIFFLIIILNCADSKKTYRYIVSDSYSKEDTVYLGNFLFRHVLINDERGYSDNSHRKLNSKMVLFEPIDDDSIFNIFSQSLRKLKFPLNIRENSYNRTDSAFFYGWYERRRLENEEDQVLDLLSLKDSSYTLVPVISILRKLYPNYADGLLNYETSIAIGVYIIRNTNEIVYHKTVVTSKNYEVYPDKEFEFTCFSNSDWDILVERVMRDYIENIE